jgi:hypothetical protein
VIAGAIIAGVAIAASAATRATFIMTNGQRASGELVYHGGHAENMIDNQLNLGNNGTEQSYSLDSVAVIDVAGGTPTQDELGKALASTQAMVMRNGYVQGGHFVNIVGGNTLIWQNDAGQQQRYGLDSIARIYLNTESARSLFNYNGPTAAASAPNASAPNAAAPNAAASRRTPAAVGTSGATSAPAPRAQKSGNGYRIQGNQPWVDTGISVKAGDQVTFHVTGQVSVAQGLPATGPEGRTRETSAKYPIPTMQAGALIGRTGTTQPFPIGTQATAITMPADGTLYLGINDDFFGDNTGAFIVTIQVNGQGKS